MAMYTYMYLDMCSIDDILVQLASSIMYSLQPTQWPAAREDTGYGCGTNITNVIPIQPVMYRTDLIVIYYDNMCGHLIHFHHCIQYYMSV